MPLGAASAPAPTDAKTRAAVGRRTMLRRRPLREMTTICVAVHDREHNTESMIESQPPTFRHAAIRAGGIVMTTMVGGLCAVGLAPRASGSPCDPVGLSMTPQPVLSCSQPDAVPPGDTAAIAPGPVNGVANSPGALPAPGQPPYVPPVTNPDGTQSYGQLGFLREIWHEFHNGVPSEFIPGPMPPPTNAVEPPPAGPAPPPPSTP